ncbi:hypothetical protein GCM10010174_18640 [Kutzneria viridogrisea]|uniref:NAD(P)-dependent dehydrogenase (Short-subunit alcohol dehydrogenase family) n=1 Tax=Kutzneria viridogrisea TaxID=47990 RepID=A0ABR6B8H5_9PSEU|nr:NAD(P)-dependent dehydrogenase (short-subunit alcohol dehydrogenase family) [Kutzneria viridogrisea]
MGTSRTVVITGAAGGIGSELVERFLKNGDTVVATDVSQETLDSWRSRWDADTFDGRHSFLHAVAGDLSSEQSIAALTETTRDRFGIVDVLVNCGDLSLDPVRGDARRPLAASPRRQPHWRQMRALHRDEVPQDVVGSVFFLAPRPHPIAPTSQYDPLNTTTGAVMSSTSVNTTVLLIGASRGLGHAIAAEYLDRGARVVATVRGTGRTALHELQDTADGQLEIEHVDITVPEQVQALRDRLGDRKFDLLFVNAGVSNGRYETSADVTTEEFTRVMVTNALSPMRVIETLGELTGPNGTIAIMSSGQGSIANNERGGFEIYRASKSALNQLMRSYAARHRDDSRTLLLMAPGWVKTEMGGSDARLTISESIPNLVTVVDAQRGRAGLQYLDYQGQSVAW